MFLLNYLSLIITSVSNRKHLFIIGNIYFQSETEDKTIIDNVLKIGYIKDVKQRMRAMKKYQQVEVHVERVVRAIYPAARHVHCDAMPADSSQFTGELNELSHLSLEVDDQIYTCDFSDMANTGGGHFRFDAYDGDDPTLYINHSFGAIE